MVQKILKHKKILYVTLSIIFVILVGVINFIYLSSNNHNILSNNKSKGLINDKRIAIMLETKRGSGIYEMAKESRWPEGYDYNASLSKCENGTELVWDEATRSISLKADVTDKCYVYFDIVPPDVYVSASNLPNAYGALANLSCSDSDATYNQKYNRIEISAINGKNTSCNLSYTDRANKVYLNNYITSLSGSTQGTGQVVSETANIPDYNSVVAISQSSYNSQSVFSSTSYSSTSGTAVTGAFTFSDNTWASVPSVMTSGTYYHFKFNPSETGYYQLCYNLSTGNSNNRLYAYINGKQQYFNGASYLSASTSSAKSGCINLDYVTTSQYIKVTQRAYTDIATLSFSVKKVSTVNSQAAGIRYEGKNPNNYVWFNNELWRIIGVFDSASHGVSGKNLVKIIRADTLDGLAWHKSDTNDWTAASLNKLLNGAYYNAQDGTDTGYCYGYSTSMTINCDYTQKGIQAGYRSMIANVTWYLGGYSSNSATTEAFYGYERGTTVYSGRPTSTTGYIGLMYPSDYGYSVLSTSCARTTNLGSYSSASCGGQSWLYGKGYEWTLSPRSSNSISVFNLVYSGDLNSYSANYGNGHRPVLYLDSSVYKIDGDGSIGNPYIIGM